MRRDVLRHGGHTFEVRWERLDTPLPDRPDEQWSYVDPAGHRHQWEWPDGRRVYQPNEPASLPTCGARPHIEIIAGEEVRQLRYECLRCRAPVNPGRVSVTMRRAYVVDGQEVTEGDFVRLMAEAGLPPPNL